MEKKKQLDFFIQKVEELTIVRAVRDALIHITPVVLIGAFALIFKSFPVKWYQDFTATFGGGVLPHLFEVIFNSTIGILSVYMTYSVSRSYMKLKSKSQTNEGGAIITSIMSFFIMSGAYLNNFGIEYMGAKSFFLAIIAGLGASCMYFHL